MQLAFLTFLLASLLAVCYASPTPLSPALSTRPRNQHLSVRQAGCNQTLCDQCRQDAGCAAGTPACFDCDTSPYCECDV
ncbi:hypothetical protein KCU65_g9556, partial [Aureobasidium melanogenum]